MLNRKVVVHTASSQKIVGKDVVCKRVKEVSIR